MAISFVGGKTHKTNGQLSGGADQTISLTDLKDESGSNATLAEDDVVLVVVNNSDNADLADSAITPNDGTTDYDVVVSGLYANDDYDCNLILCAKQMGTTPDTSVTVPGQTDTQRGLVVAIIALRGVDYANITAVTPTTATGTNSGTANAPSITPSASGSWVIAYGGFATNWNSDSETIQGTPSGFSTTTNHTQAVLEAGRNFWENGCGAIISLKTDWTSGAVDPAAFTGGSSASYASWAAGTVVAPAASAGSTTELTATTGNVDYAGYQSAITRTTNLTPSTGSVILTGYQPGITQTTTLELTPTAGSVTYTGHQPSIVGTTVYSPSTGSVSYTGYQPSITTLVLTALTPSTGAITYSGNQGSITLALRPSRGSLVYTGYRPSIAQTVTVELTPSTGLMILTGYQPGISQSVLTALTPGSGSILLTGYQPSITQGQDTFLTPSSGSMQYTGYAASIGIPMTARNASGLFIGLRLGL